jgi:hypothetical protein
VRHFFLWPREGEVVTVTSRYSIKQHTNSNKHYIYHLYSKVLKSQALLITLCPLLFVFATRFPNKTRPQSAIPRTAPGPKLCPNVALINPTQHQKIESRSETRAPPLPRIELIQNPVGSPVSFPTRLNPARRLVAPPSPCRINTKSKHQLAQPNQDLTSPNARLSSTVPRARSDISWQRLQRFGSTSTLLLVSPGVCSARPCTQL